jgi:hypothetical protein
MASGPSIAVTIDPALKISEADALTICTAVDKQAREFSLTWAVPYLPIQFYAWDVLEKLDGTDLSNFIREAQLCTVELSIGEPGALGFHDDVGGVIFSRVQYGPDWTTTFSHEVLEQTGDQTCNIYLPMPDGRKVAKEACDAVEADSYDQDGIKVSNYITLNWFDAGAQGPYDKMGTLSAPFTMSGGGYIIVMDKDGNESDVFAETPEGKAKGQVKKANSWSRVNLRCGG